MSLLSVELRSSSARISARPISSTPHCSPPSPIRLLTYYSHRTIRRRNTFYLSIPLNQLP
ncbi:hypothetical protein EUX98_g1862 [Antrodiella citrinella]|uniref:Uncharacterized protein n=1 Tax=Antrodiella citrinella TaxID=2447956 RepID=A0A4S4N3B2_9APHY|nr:hypothetical protein EUX98_g1862 [Antrodiella citrinella]